MSAKSPFIKTSRYVPEKQFAYCIQINKCVKIRLWQKVGVVSKSMLIYYPANDIGKNKMPNKYIWNGNRTFRILLWMYYYINLNF